jgi:hypothetical protein
VNAQDNPRLSSLFHPSKWSLLHSKKTPNPSILRALFLGKAQIWLRLGTDNPLFDRKLLEFLDEDGVRQYFYDDVTSEKCVWVYKYDKVSDKRPDKTNGYRWVTWLVQEEKRWSIPGSIQAPIRENEIR